MSIYSGKLTPYLFELGFCTLGWNASVHHFFDHFNQFFIVPREPVIFKIWLSHWLMCLCISLSSSFFVWPGSVMLFCSTTAGITFSMFDTFGACSGIGIEEDWPKLSLILGDSGYEIKLTLSIREQQYFLKTKKMKMLYENRFENFDDQCFFRSCRFISILLVYYFMHPKEGNRF